MEQGKDVRREEMLGRGRHREIARSVRRTRSRRVLLARVVGLDAGRTEGQQGQQYEVERRLRRAQRA